jgi:hypothetical protein
MLRPEPGSFLTQRKRGLLVDNASGHAADDRARGHITGDDGIHGDNGVHGRSSLLLPTRLRRSRDTVADPWRRPVPCAAHPDNVGYRLMKELGAGDCADVRDPASVEAALERLVLRWKQGALTPLDHVREEALRRFSRAKRAGDLAGVLEAAMRHNATPPPVPQ